MVFLLSSRAVFAQPVYWTESYSFRVRHAEPPSPLIHEVHYEDQLWPSGIAIDAAAQKLYWAGAHKIQRSNLDGTGVETISLGGCNQEIELDSAGGRMYWADQCSGFVSRAKLDGSAPEHLAFTGAPGGLAIDVEHDRMYWVDQNGYTVIYSARLDGSDRRCLIGDYFCDNMDRLPQAIGLELNPQGDMLYWTDSASGAIRRTDTDIIQVETVISGQGFPLGLDIAGNSMYWTDSVGNGQFVIKRANLDGTGATVWFSGLQTSYGIAVAPEPSTLATMLLGALCWQLHRRGRRDLRS